MEAFETIKEKLTIYRPVQRGLGAVISRTVREIKVTTYTSRGLRPSEKNNPAHKMECLTLKWAVCDKLHDYLHGSQFQVVTNNNPLTNILSKAKLNATGQRWVAAIANYNFQISYRSGHLNDENLVSSFKRLVTVLSYDLGGGFKSNGR